MTCRVFNCALDASRCAVTTYLSAPHKAGQHFELCDRDYERVERGEPVKIMVDGTLREFRAAALFECSEHFNELERKDPNVNEQSSNGSTTQPETPANEAPASGEVASAGQAKTRRTRKKAKKKATPADSVPSKVDPAHALAFVRSRIRSATDPVTKAFYTRELDDLEERVKKIEADKRANRQITVAGSKKVRIGEHVFEVETRGGGRYSNGEHPVVVALHEYVFKDIVPPPANSYSSEKIVFSKVGGGTKSFERYTLSRLYADRRSAIDHAVNDAQDEVSDAVEELDRVTKLRDALLALRNQSPTQPSNGTSKPGSNGAGRTGKHWTAEEDAQLRELIADGTSAENAARVLGRSRDRVVRRMHQIGIKSAKVPFHDFGRNAPPATSSSEADVEASAESEANEQPAQLPLLEEAAAT